MNSDWNGASRDARPDVNRDVSGSPMQKVSELADELKRQATGVTQDVTRQVKEQASHLAENAKEAASGAGDKLRNAVEDQKNAGADFVSGIASSVRRAAGEFDGQIPQAGDYIRRAAEQIDGASEALRQRDLGQLLQGVQDFARRQPTFFLGATVLAGFAAVRFLKSSKPHQPDAGRDPSTYRSENERRLAGAASRLPAEQRM